MSPAFVDNDANLDWKKIGYKARSAFAVILSLIVLIGGGWFVIAKAKEAWVAWRSEDDFIGEGKEEVVVAIPQGATSRSIADILVDSGVVKSAATFRKAATGAGATFDAGRFKLRTEIPAKTAITMLQDPANRVALKVRIKEGQARVQQWETLKTELGLNDEQLQEAAKSSELGLPAWANGEPEGFLFPDTYEIAEPVEALAVLQQQVGQFNKITGDLDFEAKAAAAERNPRDVLIVASIIEREAARAEDRAPIAGVIYNRLGKEMNLQLDSTVHYAVGDFTRVFTTEADRATDSPYNTYKNAGLPAGPISNPGKASIEAALNPADHDYLFFTAVDLDTGETRFAPDEAGHAANVAVLQQWCSDHQGRCN